MPISQLQQAVREVATICHPLQVDLLTSKVVMWPTSVPNFSRFSLPSLSVLDLGPMYVTDRRQTCIIANASALWRRGIIMPEISLCK